MRSAPDIVKASGSARKDVMALAAGGPPAVLWRPSRRTIRENSLEIACAAQPRVHRLRLGLARARRKSKRVVWACRPPVDLATEVQ
jgi:hypothetical protein